tara:strand:+ start:271 stop:732 length:462 start_codon:yes stop_codon:yes gene_type:complete
MSKHKNNPVIALKYNSSERGFIINSIADMFKPSKIKRRKLVPLVSKQDVWEELVLYVQKMKEKFPYTDGRLCEYCKKPWTYIRNKNGCIMGQGSRKKSNPVQTNFSIDRLDNNLTYTKENIVFCCGGCNNIKHQVTFDMCKKMLKMKEERNLR